MTPNKSNSAHVDPLGSEFRGVADEPLLDMPGVGFRMELKPDGVRSKLEGLVFAMLTECQARSVDGEIEGVAVPVKGHGQVAKGCQAGGLAGLCQLDGRETDLLALARVDSRPGCSCEQLRAEADAQRGSVVFEAALYRPSFVFQERVGVLVPGADRSTEYDEQVGCQGIQRRQVGGAGIHGDGLESGRLEDGRECAEILEGDVPDGKTSLHACQAIGLSARAG